MELPGPALSALPPISPLFVADYALSVRVAPFKARRHLIVNALPSYSSTQPNVFRADGVCTPRGRGRAFGAIVSDFDSVVLVVSAAVPMKASFDAQDECDFIRTSKGHGIIAYR